MVDDFPIADIRKSFSDDITWFDWLEYTDEKKLSAMKDVCHDFDCPFDEKKVEAYLESRSDELRDFAKEFIYTDKGRAWLMESVFNGECLQDVLDTTASRIRDGLVALNVKYGKNAERLVIAAWRETSLCDVEDDLRSYIDHVDDLESIGFTKAASLILKRRERSL